MPEQDVGTLARISRQEQIRCTALKIGSKSSPEEQFPRQDEPSPTVQSNPPAKTSDYEFALKNRIGHPEITLYSSHRQRQMF